VKPLNIEHRLTVKKSGKGVPAGGAQIVTADTQTEVRYIHVIDKALIPKP